MVCGLWLVNEACQQHAHLLQGIKTEKEKFAGALYTTTVEAFIPATGRGVQVPRHRCSRIMHCNKGGAIPVHTCAYLSTHFCSQPSSQGATSHCLGQNFAKMFDIQFETERADVKAHVWQNSWGITTRTIGVMIMTHADDKGMVLPPRVANVQAVVIPIPKTGMSPEENAAMQTAAKDLEAALKKAGVRTALDTRDNYTPGWKYNYWELRGACWKRRVCGKCDMRVLQVCRCASRSVPRTWRLACA